MAEDRASNCPDVAFAAPSPSCRLLPAPSGSVTDSAIKMATGGTGSAESHSPLQTMTLRRHVYTQSDLEANYTQSVPQKTFKERCVKHCTCDRVQRSLLNYVPIVKVLVRYKWQEDLLQDFVAGISVAFLHMPMGIALGLLASLPPLYGLYTTFFQVTAYTMFGTSAHVSMGTNALISLLTATAVERELDDKMAALAGQVSSAAAVTINSTGVSTLGSVLTTATSVDGMTADEQDSFKVGVAMSMSFVVGAILLGMGVLRLGFLTCFISASFMGGFTTAAAVHIASSQVSKMLGIKIESYTGAGKLVRTWIDIFENIGDANPGDIVVSVCTVAILLAVVIGINEKYQGRLKVPVPIHLILVIVATIISHFADLEDKFDIAVVGDVGSGFNSPEMPDTGVMADVLMDSLVIVVLSYALTISLAKIMAKKHSYEVDDDQELVAYGMSSLLGSFFGAHPGCTAPPRTMLLSNCGARTTFNGVFVSIFIFIIIMAAGPLFVSLPIAVLASMICVAVKNLLMQVTQLPGLWRTQKPDFLIWLFTFLTGVLADLDISIIVGVFLSFLTIIVLPMLTPSDVCPISATEDLVLQGEHRDGAKNLSNIRVFYFPSQLYFANAEKFKRELFKKVLNPSSLRVSKENQEKDGGFEFLPETRSANGTEGMGVENNKLASDTPWIIIIDCSAMTYMDLSGVNMLKGVIGAYHGVGVPVYLARCPKRTVAIMERTGVFDVLSRARVVYDIHDALKSPEALEVLQETQS